MANNNLIKPTNLEQKDLEEFDKLGLEKIISPEPKEFLPEKEKQPLEKGKREVDESEKTLEKKPVLPQTQGPAISFGLAKSPILIQIETILEDDLADVYFKMEPELQKKFKVEGEKTANKIEQLLNQTKVKAKDIFKLIFQWLKIIPGVNRFFIKQEAKIKTDKIIHLKK